jgi:hypothetical protein
MKIGDVVCPKWQINSPTRWLGVIIDLEFETDGTRFWRVKWIKEAKSTVWIEKQLTVVKKDKKILDKPPTP